MSYRIDHEFLTRTLVQLVRTNSINPNLIDSGPGEQEIARYIFQLLTQMGIEAEIEEVQPGRPNVIGVLKGRGGGRSLMLNAHMDTVGVDGMKAPFSGRVEGGRLFGRGAQDMKGSIAAMLAVAKALAEYQLSLDGDLIFAFVADEEYASIGTEAVIRKYRTDAAIVTEPTDLGICTAHKGFGIFEIKTRGKAAHGGRYQEGMDANALMGPVLVALSDLSRKLLKRRGHPLLGTSSMHIPLIKGGSELFIYAAECQVMVEWRTIPGETSEQILELLQLTVKEAALAESAPSVALKMWREPFEVPKTAKIVVDLAESLTSVLQQPPNYMAHHWWEDSALLDQAGIETVVIGPVGAGIHTELEWVDLQSVADLASTLIETAIRYCNS